MHLEIVPKDTTLEAARVQFPILRKIGMEGRARMTIENMVRLAALRIAIGEELFHQAYPDVKIGS